MSMKRFGGQVRVVLAGVLLAALVVLLILQGPKKSECYLYGYELRTSTTWVVIGSALAGLLFVWALKVLFQGIRALRQTRPEGQLKKLEKRVSQQEKVQEASGEDASQ